MVKPRELNLKSLEQLILAYQDRDRAALEWKSHGGKVVGLLGSDTGRDPCRRRVPAYIPATVPAPSTTGKD
ncbi:MAG: hypothetical protein ACOX1J_02410 [Dethiobacteria bacterium]